TKLKKQINTNKNKLANLNYYINNYEEIYGVNFDDYYNYYEEKEKCISEWEKEIKSIKQLNKELILEVLKKKYLIKLDAWKYEDEYRFIIYDHNSKDRVTFLDGINEAIEEIIIGVKANDIDIKIVEALNKNIFNDKLKISKYSDLLNEKICNDKYVYK
ncbi:hypothetical protein, partial [Clostridium sardiniense]|uniref:hypothetical protein n=1 Tax=Clostridium sardiniense TaxID=29369 RepID=UPI001957C894